MKKMNVESKRGYLLIAIILLIAISIAASIFGVYRKSAKIVKDVEELLASSEPKAVYIMREGCTYCKLNKNNMDSLNKEYNFEYYQVDTDNLVKDDLTKIINILGLDANNFGTPTLVAVANGAKLASIDGLTTYDRIFDFLKTNKLIAEDSKLYLNYPNYEEYKKIISSKERQVIVLASSTCSYCLAEQPILIEVAKETGAKINFVFLDYLFNTEEEYNEFMSSMDWFKTNSNFGTPTTLIVKEKNVRSYLTGYRSKDETIEFYRENNIIK